MSGQSERSFVSHRHLDLYRWFELLESEMKFKDMAFLGQICWIFNSPGGSWTCRG